jgi:hypothetical protein
MEKRLMAARQTLKRFAALVAFGLALALITGAGSPAATGSSVSIAPKAHVYLGGSRVEIQLTFTCSGGSGSVMVTVTQTAAQSSNGQGANGQNMILDTTKCDGSPHKLDVTVVAVSGSFDIGKATASATLTDPSTNTVTDTRTVSIVSV